MWLVCNDILEIVNWNRYYPLIKRYGFSISVQPEITSLLMGFFNVEKNVFQKLAGLWLVGEVVNHVGLYESKVAEGCSAFQRRSCSTNVDWANLDWDWIIFEYLPTGLHGYLMIRFTDDSQKPSKSAIFHKLATTETKSTSPQIELYLKT